MMRRRQSARAQRSRKTSTDAKFPAPVKGLFARNSASRVAPAMAIDLVNAFSDGYTVTFRPGLATAPQFSAPVIAAWQYRFSSTDKTVVQVEGSLQTTDGMVFATPSGRAMAAMASARLIFVAKGMLPACYDGSTFSECSFSPATQFSGIIAHHDRFFFWDEAATDAEFWYGEVGAITGNLERFPLGRLGNVKGRISTMFPLTVDAGHGANDVLCIATTTGQLIVYEGIDPGNAADWRLWGRVQLSPPVDPHAWTQSGSDTFFLTRGGVVSVMAALKQGNVALVNTATKAIGAKLKKYIREGSGLDWQMFTDPEGGFTLINVPRPDGTFRQLVFGYDAEGWFEWDIPVRAWIADADVATAYKEGRLAHLSSENVGDDGADIEITYSSPWIDLASSRSVSDLTIQAEAAGDIEITAHCLGDNMRTSRAISEADTATTIRLRHGGAEPQGIDEMIPVDGFGRTIQVRLRFSGREISWTGSFLSMA